MQFYDATNNQGISQKIDFLCDSNDTQYPRIDKTREVNNALESLVGDIINADGIWQYDDTNYSNLPVGKGTLVEGQQSYSFTSEYLQIEAVEILNKSGNVYKRIEPLDYDELGGLSPDEYFGTNSTGSPNKGEPLYYDKLGDTIFLYPAPAAASVTLTNGLKVKFKRTASLFAVSSGTSADTQEPGLPSTHHEIIAYMAAIPFCMKYQKDRVRFYQQKVAEMKKTLLEHYAHREQDEVSVIRTKIKSFR